jgi:hypothetical protein
MRTLYESILDDIDVITQKAEKHMAQKRLISDLGLWEINPMTSGGRSADWLKCLDIKSDYTDIFAPYVKKQKNWFNKYSSEYSMLVGIILNMLVLVKNSNKDIYVWNDFDPGPKPDGLVYMEKLFKKMYHCDIIMSCADMLDDDRIVVRLEIYNPDSRSFFYIYFDEERFFKYMQ